ncbi:MAG: chemotaxis-specific protein-glutamate methyltransferase CheB [Rectinemataceae bacterium]
MRVLIADDSILIRNVVQEILATDSSITLVGIATNGEEAVDRALSLDPDIVIMDIDMPIMDGLEATARIIAASPIPIIVFTHNTDPGLPFRAIEKGAVDFLLKPDFAALNRPDYVSGFIARLKALSSKHQRRRVTSGGTVRMKSQSPSRPATPSQAAPSQAAPSQAAMQTEFPAILPRSSIVVVGASTGGPQAVSAFLSSLPKPFPLPIALVQHIETGFDGGYADWLAEETGHPVVLARDGDALRPGTVHVGPTDFHMLIAEKGITLNDDVKVQNQKPSVDVLFRSAAACRGRGVLAVLLTGMGADGAEGCVEVRSRGGFTVVQDEASSLIFGMPRAAIARGAASIVLSLDRIGPFVATVARQVP